MSNKFFPKTEKDREINELATELQKTQNALSAAKERIGKLEAFEAKFNEVNKVVESLRSEGDQLRNTVLQLKVSFDL